VSSPAGRARRGDFLRGRRAVGWLQLAASAAALSFALLWFDLGGLRARLADVRAPWLALGALGVSLQIVLMGTRWWYLARRLGVGLPYRRAVAEYGLSTLLNQVLPGGIAGDAVRGVRHHRGVDVDATLHRAGTRVVVTLVLDRLSGQLALWAVVLATLPAWWRTVPLTPSARALVLGLPLATGLALGAGWVLTRGRPWREAARQVWERGGRAAFSLGSSGVHLGLSLLLIGLHLLVFWAVARSMHLVIEPSALLRIVPLLLLVSSLPAFFAGWGVREATAAALFQLSQLRASDGASVSLVFGVVSLLGSVPGLLAIVSRRRATA